MLIRKGKADDAEKCLELLALDNEKYWEASDFRNSAHHGDMIFPVAEEDNRRLGYVLGFIMPTKRSEALVHETRVPRKKRGKGIGTELVNAFCRKVLKKGAKMILAEIAHEQAKFYCDACGFKEVNKWIEVARKKRAL